MIRLSRDDYHRILPLIANSPMRGHLALSYAVLEGQPGMIFADDYDQPQTALICNASGFYFAFGRPDRQAVEATLPQLIAELPPYGTALFATTEAWRMALNSLFARTTQRTAFAFEPTPTHPPQNWREQMPVGFTIALLTEDVAQRIDAGASGLDPWFIRIVGGPARFAAYNLGMCVLANDYIAGFCAFCAIGGGEAELEVGTDPAFRGRGLATVAGAAFIEQCRTQGLEPAYSATSGNAPSIAVAAKLGFRPTDEITGYPLEPSFAPVNGVWQADQP